MPMQNPPHPGEIVRLECLEPLGLTVTGAAKGLGVTRQVLSDLVNEKAGVSVEMSIRLSLAFGSTPETWLAMQTAYDLCMRGTEPSRSRWRDSRPQAPHRRCALYPKTQPAPRHGKVLGKRCALPLAAGVQVRPEDDGRGGRVPQPLLP